MQSITLYTLRVRCALCEAKNDLREQAKKSPLRLLAGGTVPLQI